MALLPVLFIISLITIIVVMFFSLSTLQYKSSTAQAAAQDVGSLRDTALNIAIGQLRQGTTEANALWISQPGAIRTYAANSGTASNIYKLYSAGEMTTAADGLTAAAQNLESDVPGTWNAMPQVYANLNEPTIRENGDLSFPIIDPRAMDSINPVYPVSQTPEGFRYSDKLAVSDATISGVRPPGTTPEDQRLPMPVRWIYILANGTYGVLDPTTKNFIPFQGQGVGSTPSPDNPIAGRIAFWTDDETSKVNINTASEGIHWDTPRAATPEDVEYAKQPPARNEVQRFGGHPASTSLSSVFFPGQRLLPGTPEHAIKLKQIYDMVPRVNFRSINDPKAPAAGILGANATPIAYDSDRLYASVDEFLFQAPSASSATPDVRPTQPLFASNPKQIARLRFFLTAESRAPETTSLGTPRMSLWPISGDPNKTSSYYTSFDRVAMFSTTLGGKTYSYRRYSSPTSALSEYGLNSAVAQDWNKNLKGNADLGDYLVALSANNLQGYPASMTDKFGSSNTAAGIISMLEYVRQTNIHDTTLSTAGTKVSPYDMGIWGKDTYGPSEAHGQIINVADTMVPPSIGDQLRADPDIRLNALNRIYTISEFGLVLSLAAENRTDGTKFNDALVTSLKLPPGYKAIQVGTVFEGFCPSQGYSMIAPAVGTWIDGLQYRTSPTTNAKSGLTIITSQSPNGRLPGGDITKTTPAIEQTKGLTSLNEWQRWGRWQHSVPSLAYLTGINMPSTIASKQSQGAKWWVGWGGSSGRYHYIDPPTDAIISGGYETNVKNVGVNNFYMTQFGETSSTSTHASQYSRGFYLVPSSDTHVTLKSTSPLELYSGYVNHGPNHSRILHVITIPPNMVVPVPKAPVARKPTWRQRLIDASAARARLPEIIDPNDVVRTWTVRHGDYRLSSLRENERPVIGQPSSLPEKHRLFAPHPSWNPAELPASELITAQDTLQIHSFTKSGGEWETPSARPSRGLANGVTYAAKNQPDFVRDPASAQYFPGKPSSYPYSVDPSETRDWDNGTGIAPDGAYWNKPDDVAQQWEGTIPPYFTAKPWDGVRPEQLNQTVAPNQLIPSAVMFGSISSGVHTGLPWTTYLFRPNLSPVGHLGEKGNAITGTLSGAPPDHAILDWFWMPVLQPYAVSEPFSTAGKINMNYRIVPFTHIKRATGLHAVMKSERLLAIPTSAGSTYKDYASATSNNGWRHYLDIEKTLIQWEDRFDAGQFFKTPGEICEQFLVPEGQNISSEDLSGIRSDMTDFWDDHKLSGDNTLERPYANLYPRLTTRSNTFRVHYLVQTVRKARTSDPLTYDPEKDNITGESQGDALIERAIDPNDPALSTPDYDYLGKANTGTLNTARSLDTLYTWRIRHLRNFGR